MRARRYWFWITCALTACGAAGTSLTPRNVAAAAHDIGDASEMPRIRIHRDGRTEKIIDEAISASPTFREVVNRLNRSDVVVYIRCQKDVSNREAGYLKFIGSAAGYRYLQAHVRYNTSRPHQMALIGHELFHAAEVAGAPSVIDAASFEREYARIGFVSRTFRVGGGVAYDTHAAIDAGEQILRELNASPKQRQRTRVPLLAGDPLPDVPAIGGERAVE
jgi:hypothetical protein